MARRANSQGFKPELTKDSKFSTGSDRSGDGCRLLLDVISQKRRQHEIQHIDVRYSEDPIRQAGEVGRLVFDSGSDAAGLFPKY
jgi:hypothetical protein